MSTNHSSLESIETNPIIHTHLNLKLDGGWQMAVLTFFEELTTRLLYKKFDRSEVTQIEIRVNVDYQQGVLVSFGLHFFMKQKLAVPQERVGCARPLEWEPFNLSFEYTQEGEEWIAPPDAGRFNAAAGLVAIEKLTPVEIYQRIKPEFGIITIPFPLGFVEPVQFHTSILKLPPKHLS
jgi:hypothetical protein